MHCVMHSAALTLPLTTWMLTLWLYVECAALALVWFFEGLFYPYSDSQSRHNDKANYTDNGVRR